MEIQCQNNEFVLLNTKRKKKHFDFLLFGVILFILIVTAALIIFYSPFEKEQSISLNFPRKFTFFSIEKKGMNDEIKKLIINLDEKTLKKTIIKDPLLLQNIELKSFALIEKHENSKDKKNYQYQKIIETISRFNKFFEEDYKTNKTFSYINYEYINYTQCYYYDQTVDQNLFNLIDDISKMKNLFIKGNEEKILYKNQQEIKLIYSQITQNLEINLSPSINLVIPFSNPIQQNMEEILSIGKCFHYNLTQQEHDDYNKTQDSIINDRVFEFYKEKIHAEFDGLILTSLPENQFSLAFKFCGNWCGPSYGGFNDENCKEICLKDLEKPSEECKRCKPPVNKIDEICMLHDFCCMRSYLLDRDYCGTETTSFDCGCHIEMFEALGQLDLDFFSLILDDCSFVNNIMMQFVFRNLKCRCKNTEVVSSIWKTGLPNEDFTAGYDRCIPAKDCH